MILKRYNALWYANPAVLRLNGKSYGGGLMMIPSDRALATFYRLSIVNMTICDGLAAIFSKMF